MSAIISTYLIDHSNHRCLVNRLPTELIARIFYLGTHLVDGPYTPVPFPVLASHVCHLWRSIALGSPSLWTNIIFSKRLPYEHYRIWIERSKDLPIEITFDLIWSAEDSAHEILDIIVPHVSRWRKLKVVVDSDVHTENILTRLAQCDSAPLLEVLGLSDCGPDVAPTSSMVPFHGNAPRLSYVTLEAVHFSWSSSLLHDLVEFKLANQIMDGRPRWSDFSRILRASPRLTNLQLFYSGPAEPLTDWQDDPIELPSLENLSLTHDDPIYISSLFWLLSMPNLKKLSLDFHTGDFSEFIRKLATSHRSVLSGLRYLGIDELSCDSSAIKPMYEQLTNLECIHLNGKWTDKSFFTMLMEPFSGTLYCPNLTTVITWVISGREMRSFVEARATSGIPIKRVAMSWGHDPDLNKEDERWLRDNVRSFERFRDVDDIDIDVQY